MRRRPGFNLLGRRQLTIRPPLERSHHGSSHRWSERCDRLGRLAHFTTRYRWPVIAVWIVLTLFGGVAAGQLSTRWYQSTADPRQAGLRGEPADARRRSESARGRRTSSSSTRRASTSRRARRCVRRWRASSTANPRALTSSYFSTGNLDVRVARPAHDVPAGLSARSAGLDVKSGAAKMRAAGGGRASGRDHRQRDGARRRSRRRASTARAAGRASSWRR